MTGPFGERVADDIASFGGSWPFIFIFLGMIVVWIVVNTLFIQHVLAPAKPFDPYPYIALNLVLSGLAGIQAPIIMMSQNRAAARDEILAAHHYDETHNIDELLGVEHRVDPASPRPHAEDPPCWPSRSRGGRPRASNPLDTDSPSCCAGALNWQQCEMFRSD